MAMREWVETASSWGEIRIFKLALKRQQATPVLLSFSDWSNLTLFVDFMSI